MKKISQKENLVTTTQLAKQLKTTNDVILDVAKRCKINKEIKNGRPTYWNEEDVSIIIKNIGKSNASKEALVQAKGQTKTTLMIKEEAQQGIENIQKLDLQEQAQASLFLCMDTLKKLVERNDELTNWKNEKLAIENKEYKNKELRTKINRLIRQKAKENGNFKDTWNKYYTLYCSIHCFTGKQDLDMVQDRGHLDEFYNLILNN